MKKSVLILLCCISFFSCKKNDMYVAEISFYIDGVYCTQTGGGIDYNVRYIDGKPSTASYYLMSGTVINYQNSFVESETPISFELFETEVGAQILFMGENIRFFSCKYNDRWYKYAYGYIQLERMENIDHYKVGEQDIPLKGTFDMTLVWKDDDKILPNDTIHLTDGKFYFSHIHNSSSLK